MKRSTLALALTGAHLLLDYAGQGDFMSKAKNHKAPIPGVPWYTILASHAAMHGIAVALLTRSLGTGLTETLIHFATDYAKSEGLLTFNEDQAIHLACKAVYAALGRSGEAL